MEAGRAGSSPIAAVVSVGDELLAGDAEDTNARWLARELAALGLRVAMMATLPDRRESIARFVAWAHSEYDVVVVTGGLGGTPDDVTRDALADALGVDRVLDEELAHAYESAGGHAAVFARTWCSLPEGSRPLPGLAGGAPAFAVENVYSFPGVPDEMKAAFAAAREELRRGPAHPVWRRVYETSEDRITKVLEDAQREHVDVRIGSYPRGRASRPQVELVVRAKDEARLAVTVAYLEERLAVFTTPLGPPGPP